jgi:surface antigen
MKTKIALMAAAAALCLTALPAPAQNYGSRNDGPRDPQNYDQTRDEHGYYSRSDQSGYYDPDGRYRHSRSHYDQRDERFNNADQRTVYYQQGQYERSCRGGNAVAGTIFGALAGGLAGSAVSRGNGGAVIGGAVLGGLLGHTVAKDIACDDQPAAFSTYSSGLNGEVGHRYSWTHNQARGYFQPTRDYRRGGVQCRDFTETTYRGNREMTHNGTACRANDGQWRFD